ncbi:MAG TPA: hypothetical protein VFM24_07880 [Nitrospira sp.]|nr:hypothetical protein [Nitrospira sp.]
MKRWVVYLIIVLLAAAAVDYYFLVKLTPPLDLEAIWKTAHKPSAGSPANGQEGPAEIRALRQRHRLRPLTQSENGSRVRDVAKGTYGFAACDVQTIHASRTDSPTLEIHKHADGIVYYVGYASEDQIEKYLTRQKNFHILMTLQPRGKASLVLEIPVDFVSKCTASSNGGSSQFDLFVTAIPELQS